MNAGIQSCRRGRCKERGVAAMELALLIPLFVIMVCGVVEFGHAWYIHHCITNASREAARFGIRHNGKYPRECPTEAQIRTVAKEYLKKFFNDEYLNEVTITNTLSRCAAGEDLTVTISMPKHWFILGPLIGLGDVNLTAMTTMKLE